MLLVDSLRGVAASAVMLYHLYNAVAPRRELAVPEVVHHAFMLGEGGVQIFFVLSGFVIASNLEGMRRLTPSTIGRFMLRRSIRLDPVYWVLIALNGAFLVALSTTDRGAQLGPSVVLANMFYVNGMLGQLFIVPVGWTLAFEVQLYVMLATALAIQRALGRQVGEMASRACVFAPLVVVSGWLATKHTPIATTPWAVAAWHMFFLGVVAHWWTQKKRASLAHLVVGLLTTGTVFLVTGEPVTVLAPVTALGLVGAAHAGALARPLGGAPLQWLGKVSYSLYLVHPLIGNKLLRFAVGRWPSALTGLEDQLARWGLFLVAVSLSLAAAWLLWRFVERPAQSWARNVALEPTA